MERGAAKRAGERSGHTVHNYGHNNKDAPIAVGDTARDFFWGGMLSRLQRDTHAGGAAIG